MKDCLFCKIINKEISAKVVWETNNILVIRDINPKAPIHLLVMPKKHIATVNDLQEEDKNIVSDLIFTSKDVAKKEGINESGYKLIVHVGEKAGQEIFHLHIHVLGGW